MELAPNELAPTELAPTEPVPIEPVLSEPQIELDAGVAGAVLVPARPHVLVGVPALSGVKKDGDMLPKLGLLAAVVFKNKLGGESLSGELTNPDSP